MHVRYSHLKSLYNKELTCIKIYFDFSADNLSFSDLLSEFLSEEDLKGDNQYSCDKCGRLRDALKVYRILFA